MDISAIEFLRRLGSGIRPDGRRVPPRPVPIEHKAFAQLMSGVQAGAVSSGRDVDVDPSLAIEFSPEQLQRLALVVDAGEAAGADRMLAILDDRALGIDVSRRHVFVADQGLAGRVLRDFDAAVIVPELGSDAVRELFATDSHAQGVRTPSAALAELSLVRNGTVADLLARRSRGPTVGEEFGPGGAQPAA